MSPGGRLSGPSRAGGSKAAPGKAGGPTTPNAGTKRDGDTTPDDGACEGDAFTPGQNGTLTWNTTQEIDGRPILLYVLDGHSPSGLDYDFSRKLELELLKDKAVIREAEDFVCEKICVKEKDFLDVVKDREVVSSWLRENMAKPEQRRARLVLLDAKGGLLRSFDFKKLKGAKPEWLVQELRKAVKANGKSLAPKKG
jgi:hypothetical protein